MDYQYLSKDQLLGFENYKYSAVDTNPLSNYVMHPFWNHVVKVSKFSHTVVSPSLSLVSSASTSSQIRPDQNTLVPKWLAPNVLTFSGFLLTVGNAMLLATFDYDFSASSDSFPLTSPIPQWVWIMCAINHFLAHTLDGIDGKHARRTNSSGPLGELMDHGLDSWTAVFMPTCMYSVFGRGEYSCNPLRVFFSLWSVYLCFISSHWEKYNTGVLYLPWGYDISQVVLLFAFLKTYFQSYKCWKFTVPILNIGSGEVIELLIYGGTFVMSIPVSLFNIYCAYKNGTLKQTSFWEAMRPLVPIFWFFVITTVWTIHSPTDVISRDPRVFYWMVGTVFSNIACRLIVCQMSSTRCEIFNWMLYPILMAMAAVFLSPKIAVYEVEILWAILLFSILAHIHYGICVVRQMCSHFNICAFSLRKPSKE